MSGEGAKPTRPPVALAPEGTGRRLVGAAWGGVIAQVAGAVAGATTRWGRGPYTVLCTLLLLGGVVAMGLAFARAVGRSRDELVDVAGLFLLLGSAPRRTRLALWVAVGVQTAVGLAGAAARPYTSLAFGVLAPLWAYGLTVLWNAVHGAFPPRPRRA